MKSQTQETMTKLGKLQRWGDALDARLTAAFATPLGRPKLLIQKYSTQTTQ